MGPSVGGVEYFLPGLKIKAFFLLCFNPEVEESSKRALTFRSGPVQCPLCSVHGGLRALPESELQGGCRVADDQAGPRTGGSGTC